MSFTEILPFATMMWFHLTVGHLLPPELTSAGVRMGSVLVTAVFQAPRMVLKGGGWSVNTGDGQDAFTVLGTWACVRLQTCLRVADSHTETLLLLPEPQIPSM